MLGIKIIKCSEEVWRERISWENKKNKVWAYQWELYVKETDEMYQRMREIQEQKEAKFPIEIRKLVEYKKGVLPPKVRRPNIDDSHIPKYTSRMIGWKSTQPCVYTAYCKPNSWERGPRKSKISPGLLQQQ